MPAAGGHQLTFLSLRGPAKAVHQRAREERELSGWVLMRNVELNVERNVECDQKCPSILFGFTYVNKYVVK